MIILLVRNKMKTQSKSIAIGIREYLVKQGIKVYAENDDAASIGANPLSDIKGDKIDFIFSLGGDGTLLRLVHNHPDLKAPIMAINLGSLGFMADIQIKDIYPSIQDLLSGKFTIQERMVMDGLTQKGESNFAVNDIVVHRHTNPSLIDLAIHIDGVYLNTFSADGIIISTPSGSTAYSLAAGGPILTPELEAFVITPICPHTISNKPIVLMPKQEIQVQYISDYDPAETTFDGLVRYPLTSGSVVSITLSKRKFPLVSLYHHEFFSTLRTKLSWAGKLRA